VAEITKRNQLKDLNKHSGENIVISLSLLMMKPTKIATVFCGILLATLLSSCFLSKKKCDCPKFSRVQTSTEKKC
jgi:hypothetical protein